LVFTTLQWNKLVGAEMVRLMGIGQVATQIAFCSIQVHSC